MYDDRKIVECVDCHKPTDPKGNGNFIEAHGWIEYRGGVGGASNLKWKRHTGRVMCAKCAQDRIYGVKDQTSLF